MNAPESRLATTAVRTDREWLEPHWMPYAANRAFKADPHIFVAGEGAWLTTHDGRRLYDSLSGLWCTGLGHCRTEISAAIARQASTLDTPSGSSVFKGLADLVHVVLTLSPKPGPPVRGQAVWVTS